jgi:hypothetical protein
LIVPLGVSVDFGATCLLSTTGYTRRNLNFPALESSAPAPRACTHLYAKSLQIGLSSGFAIRWLPLVLKDLEAA